MHVTTVVSFFDQHCGCYDPWSGILQMCSFMMDTCGASHCLTIVGGLSPTFLMAMCDIWLLMRLMVQHSDFLCGRSFFDWFGRGSNCESTNTHSEVSSHLGLLSVRPGLSPDTFLIFPHAMLLTMETYGCCCDSWSSTLTFGACNDSSFLF